MSDNASSVEYREIPEWPGYRVGNDGSIWSRKRNWKKYHWKLLPQNANTTSNRRHGYPTVRLQRNRKRIRVAVHPLVLKAFIGGCPPGKQCRHLDGNPSNNSVSNLRWGTPLENSQDRSIHGHTCKGEDQENSKLTELQVREIKASRKTPTQLSRIYPVTDVMIGLIVRGKSWKHVK